MRSCFILAFFFGVVIFTLIYFGHFDVFYSLVMHYFITFILKLSIPRLSYFCSVVCFTHFEKKPSYVSVAHVPIRLPSSIYPVIQLSSVSS